MTRRDINISALRSWMKLPPEAEGMLRELVEKSIFQKFDAYDRPMLRNSIAKYWPLVVRGRIRIFLEEPDGNQQITLYETLPGEACAISASCAALSEKFPAIAEVIEDTWVLLLPFEQVSAFAAKYSFFNKYLMRMTNERLLQMIGTFARSTFQPVELRLRDYLLQKKAATNSDYLPITHREIAHDLGTAREVITRKLAKLQEDKVIAQSRGGLVILNREALAT